MPRGMSLIRFGLAATAWLSFTALAQSDVDLARQLFETAQTLFKQGKYAEARASFEAAYRIKPHPVVHFNLGKCHERLGDVPAALRHYREYLRLLPEAKDRSVVIEAIAALERNLKASGLQQLAVHTEPPAAVAEVDGRDAGKTPLWVELAPGVHQIVLRRTGYDNHEQRIEIPDDRSIDLVVALVPLGAAPTPPDQPPPPPPVATLASPRGPTGVGPTGAPPAPPVRIAEAEVPPSVSAAVGEAPKPRRRVWTYVAAAGAGAGLAAGVGLGLAASAASGEMLSRRHPQPEVQGLYDQTLGLARASNVAYGAAVIAGAAAAVAFLLESRGSGTLPPSGDAFAVDFHF